MKANEGKLDRTLRIALGAFLLSLVVWGPQTSWGYVGIIPLITGVVGMCPLYSLCGINTCPIKNKKH